LLAVDAKLQGVRQQAGCDHHAPPEDMVVLSGQFCPADATLGERGGRDGGERQQGTGQPGQGGG